MATDTNILREFLVSLGFKVENADTFKKTIEDTTKFVGKLGTTLEALGIAGLAAVNKVSQKFESLAYASQRLHASVRQIQAFQYALSQVGGNADDARSSLENFAGFMRRTGGAGLSILTGLGINVKDEKGKIKSYTELVTEFGEAARKAGAGNFNSPAYAQWLGAAKVFGIDEGTFQGLMRNPRQFESQFVQQQKKAGINPDQIAKAQAKFARDIRAMMNLLDQFKDKLTIDLEPIFGKLIKLFEDLDGKTHSLSTGFIALAAVVLPLATIIGPIPALVVALAGAFALLYSDFQKWQSGQASILPWADWAPQLKGIWQDINAIGDIISDVFGGAKIKNAGGVLKAFVSGELKALKDMLDAILHAFEAIRDFKQGKVGQGFGKLGEAAKSFGRAAVIDQFNTAKDEVQSLVRGDEGKSKPLENFARSAGNVAGYIGRQLSSRGIDAEHVKGILAGIYAESGFNPTAKNPTSGALGIGQWLGPRLKALIAKYGPHPNLAQQTEFLISELFGGDRGGKAVLGAQGADATLQAYAGQFMRAGSGVGGDIARGRRYLATNPGNYTQINVKTDIHVHGTGSPEQTADAVARQQQRVYGNTLRWNKPAAS